jgi:signal transduction histidine kinase
VDREESLVIEIKDDSKERFSDAIGFATYSNSRSTVLSYISIFESFWLQSELYMKVKEAEQVQKDFINIAAHEIRNPIQPILSLTDIIRKNEKDLQQKELLDVVVRNAKKLKQLTDDVLDVTRIETKSFQLNKEKFNLYNLIMYVIQDYRNQITDSIGVKLVLENRDKENNKDTNVVGDKQRISQVIFNLVSNSAKFTGEGGIISIKIKSNDEVITVSVKDTGTGIDPQIMPRLFTKFATKSNAGTGLGLFISKNIVEAHGGKMWAENNKKGGKGATFHFSLPQRNIIQNSATI